MLPTKCIVNPHQQCSVHSDPPPLYLVVFFGMIPPSFPNNAASLTVFCNRKIPWRLSSPQKRRQRKRLRLVDTVVATVDRTLKKNGMATATSLERWKEEMPTEGEMKAKDKYTIFDRKEKKYRKGVHSKSSLMNYGWEEDESDGSEADFLGQSYRSGRGLVRG